MGDVIILPPPLPKPPATFWCPQHSKYDLCVLELNCPQHPNPRETYNYRDCICDGKAWKDYKSPETVCGCSCHTSTYRSSSFPVCAEWCCKKWLQSQNLTECLCLCHYEFAVACGKHSKCCDRAKPAGATDEFPNWGFMALDSYPWNCGVDTRRHSKRSRDNVNEQIHLKMTVNGDRLATDLFYILLYACDTDFPIRSMRKVGDTIPYCRDCKGYIWERCCLGPVEIHRAARQVVAKTGLSLDVKVHHWMKAANCGCREVEFIPVTNEVSPVVVQSKSLVTVN